MKRRIPFLVLGLFLVLAICFASCAAPTTPETPAAPETPTTPAAPETPTTPAAPETPTTPAAPAGTITWDQAKDNVDKTVTACGKIVEVNDMGDAYVMGMGDSMFTGGLCISVKKTDVATVGGDDKVKGYTDKEICVNGLLFKNPFGSFEIAVTDPAQITEAGAAPAAATPPAGGAAGTITWDQAKDNVDKTVTACGKIVEVNDMGDAYVMGMGDSMFTGGLCISVKKTDVATVGGDDKVKGYTDKEICVNGLLFKNPFGSFEIAVKDPAQITEK